MLKIKDIQSQNPISSLDFNSVLDLKYYSSLGMIGKIALAPVVTTAWQQSLLMTTTTRAGMKKMRRKGTTVSDHHIH